MKQTTKASFAKKRSVDDRPVSSRNRRIMMKSGEYDPFKRLEMLERSSLMGNKKEQSNNKKDEIDSSQCPYDDVQFESSRFDTFQVRFDKDDVMSNEDKSYDDDISYQLKYCQTPIEQHKNNIQPYRS